MCGLNPILAHAHRHLGLGDRAAAGVDEDRDPALVCKAVKKQELQGLSRRLPIRRQHRLHLVRILIDRLIPGNATVGG